MSYSRPTLRKPTRSSELGRVVTFLRFLARGLLSLVVGAYVDDVFCSESNYLVRSGFWAFKRLCSILGFITSDRKDQRPSASMHLLGDEVALLGKAIRTRSTDERAQKLRCAISEILSSNCLTPAGASKLRGKLSFFTSLLMGRFGQRNDGPVDPAPIWDKRVIFNDSSRTKPVVVVQRHRHFASDNYSTHDD